MSSVWNNARGTLCHTPPHDHVTHEGVTHVLLDPRVEMLPGRRVHQVSHSRSLRAVSVTHSAVPLQSLCHTQRCLCKCSPVANVSAGSFTVSAFKTKASTQCPPEDVNNPDQCSCSPALADVARILPRATGLMIVGPVTRGMLPASRPEVRAPPRTEEFRQLCA